MERIDLFEQTETLPFKVNEILTKYEAMENDYESCANLVKDLETVGYTCEYYLDAQPYGLRKIINKGNSYTYEELENFTRSKGLDDAEFSLEEFGVFQVGVQFLVLDHLEDDEKASFVLTGTMGDNSIYECVYTDFK